MNYVKAKDLVAFKTGKLDSNAAEEGGLYPFFTCSQTTYQINSFAFDTECVLLAGNNAGAIFPLKYYNGKFNAYQRTYIIETKQRNRLNIKYFYFFLRPYLKTFEQQATGATTKFLTIKILNNIQVALPDIEIQDKIADILTAYDDLIETNNQRIATLEAIAQQIYKEWFVRLRFPNWEHTPFHHGIPDGWEICRLESLCRNLTDGTHDTPKSTSYGHFLITGKHINEENFIDFSGAYFISEDDHIKISNRSGLDEGDIIFSNIGTIGSCAVIKGEKDFSVKNVLIFKPKENYLTTFLFYLLTNKSTLEQLLLSSSGASQQFIGLTFARDFKVLVPNDNLLKDFNKLVEPLMEKKYALNESNQVLTKTRNLLLPRLISGKLTLKQATQQITSL